MHFECFSLSGLAWTNYQLHLRGMLPLYISHLIDLDEISLKILFLFLLFFSLMQPSLIPQQSSFRSLRSPLVCLYCKISFLSCNAEEIISWCFSLSEYWHRCCWKWRSVPACTYSHLSSCSCYLVLNGSPLPWMSANWLKLSRESWNILHTPYSCPLASFSACWCFS